MSLSVWVDAKFQLKRIVLLLPNSAGVMLLTSSEAALGPGVLLWFQDVFWLSEFHIYWINSLGVSLGYTAVSSLSTPSKWQLQNALKKVVVVGCLGAFYTRKVIWIIFFFTSFLHCFISFLLYFWRPSQRAACDRNTVSPHGCWHWASRIAFLLHRPLQLLCWSLLM